MFRRKNQETSYGQTNNNQSPYRFERKNPNLSPGLSPMRCRTPTRGNVSPLRGTTNNENRGHSPVRFVSSKLVNPSNKGFFRIQNPHQYVQKYATSTTNNDHSFKRQSYHDHENNSRIRTGHGHQNSQRTTLHQNTKLFSKLVQKLNSQKKKEPQLMKKNTKLQLFKPTQNIAHQYKSTGGVQKITKIKSQTQNLQINTINNQIKPVQSVVYQEKQVYMHSYQTNTYNVYNYGKQNKVYQNEHVYRIKQNNQKQAVIPLETAKSKNTKVQKQQQKITLTKKTSDKSQKTPPKMEQPSKNQNIKSGKKQLQRYEQKNLAEQHKICSKQKSDDKIEYENLDNSCSFEDIRMFLSKLKEVPSNDIKNQQSYNNNSNVTNNLNISFMTMDPF